MPKYRVTTEGGTYEVTTGDAAPPSVYDSPGRKPGAAEATDAYIAQNTPKGDSDGFLSSAYKTSGLEGLMEAAKALHEGRAPMPDFSHPLMTGLRMIGAIPGQLKDTGEKVGTQLADGNYGGAAGSMAGVVAPLVAPELAARGVGAVKGAVQGTAKAGAKNLMKSALKPGVADAETMTDVRAVVDTALKERIPATEAGSSKLSVKLTGRQAEIQQVIDGLDQQGGTVLRSEVVKRLLDKGHQLGGQALPAADLALVDKAIAEFNTAHPTTIPAGRAQQIKQGTYQQTYTKAGESKATQIDIEKQLARGFKEELETLAPELKGLNAAEGELLNLQKVLDRTVRREGNKDLVGDFVGKGIISRTIDSAAFKSNLALALNKAAARSGNPVPMLASQTRAAAIIKNLTPGAAAQLQSKASEQQANRTKRLEDTLNSK